MLISSFLLVLFQLLYYIEKKGRGEIGENIIKGQSSNRNAQCIA